MILVVGATGALGGLIASRLLARGERVRILIRKGSPYEPLVEAGAEAVSGDLQDAASLAAACAGVRAIITTATAAGRASDDTFETVDDAGNRNPIDAAVTAGVERFVFVSVLGSDPESAAPLLHAKGLTEEREGFSYTDSWLAAPVACGLL